MNRLLLMCGLSMLAAGCARYEYELVQPQSLARHLGARPQDAALEPLIYRMYSIENRLVLDIHNTTRELIRLQGDRSYVIAPDGQSHPLRNLPVAPEAYGKLVLPPMRPYYEPYGPRFGIGFGWAYGGYYPYYPYGAWRRPWYGPWAYEPYGWGYDEPRYYVFYDENDRTFWQWEGETDIKLHLVWQQNQKTFAHDFAFHRRKM